MCIVHAPQSSVLSKCGASHLVSLSETNLSEICGFLQVADYIEAQNELDKLAAVALKRIQHFYYKTGRVHPHIVWG